MQIRPAACRGGQPATPATFTNRHARQRRECVAPKYLGCAGVSDIHVAGRLRAVGPAWAMGVVGAAPGRDVTLAAAGWGRRPKRRSPCCVRGPSQCPVSFRRTDFLSRQPPCHPSDAYTSCRSGLGSPRRYRSERGGVDAHPARHSSALRGGSCLQGWGCSSRPSWEAMSPPDAREVRARRLDTPVTPPDGHARRVRRICWMCVFKGKCVVDVGTRSPGPRSMRGPCVSVLSGLPGRRPDCGDGARWLEIW